MIRLYKKIRSWLRLRSGLFSKKASLPKIASARFEVEEVSLQIRIPREDGALLKRIKNIVLNDPWCVPVHGVDLELGQSGGDGLLVTVAFKSLNKEAVADLRAKILQVTNSL